MNAKRATVLGALAVLALGMSACAPGAPTEPSEPTTPVTESTTAAAPAPTPEPAPTTPSEEPPAEDPTSDSPSDTPFITPADGDLPGAAACYVDGEPRTGLEGADIPAAGAVKAWLCGEAPGGYGTVGPMEPLLSGVDGIIDAFTQLPDANPEGPQVVADIYRIVFEYADGSYATIEGDDQTDGPIWVGDNRRAGGEQFLNQVRGLWLDQRLAVGDPAEPAVGHATATPRNLPRWSWIRRWPSRWPRSCGRTRRRPRATFRPRAPRCP